MGVKLPVCLYSGVLQELQNADSIAGTSKLLQWAYVLDGTVVEASENMPEGTSAPTTSQGDPYPELALAFTPASAGSILEVHLELALVGTAGGDNIVVALFDSLAGNSAVDVWYGYTGMGGKGVRAVLTTFRAAGSTAERTFSVRLGPAASGAVYVNAAGPSTDLYGAAYRSMMSVKEYAL